MNLHHYIEQFAELDLRRVDKLDLDEIENYDAIVLSPGPKLPKDFPILEQIIQNYHQHKPILGVCLGMQALADFFGFELKQLQQVKHGLSEELVDVDNQFPLFRGLKQPIFVARYHSWQVEHSPKLKQDFNYSAFAKDQNLMAFQHKTLPILGVQFHPESIMTPQGLKMIENWVRSLD